MQRRAAAVYAAFLIVLAAGAYAAIGVAQEPAISIQNPDHSLAVGEQATIGGRTYTVASLDDTSGELVWVDASARQTETWDNGSSVTVGDTDFAVSIPAADEPTSFTLREEQQLGEDVTTVEVDGDPHVVVEGDDGRELVPREDYLRQQFGAPEVRRLSVGDRLDYQNRSVEVSAVTAEAVTVAWTESVEHTVTVSEGATVELGGTTYVAHFEGSTVELSTDVSSYERQEQLVEQFHERINGLWAVSILGSLATILLLGMAYLPSRY